MTLCANQPCWNEARYYVCFESGERLRDVEPMCKRCAEDRRAKIEDELDANLWLVAVADYRERKREIRSAGWSVE